jgi:lactoylglutathione lyase
MPYRINHIHIKAIDPRKTAEWWANTFDFKIVSDETRQFGDRFVRCDTGQGGLLLSISNARTGETLGPGNAAAHFGLEHFAIETDDIEAEIARLETLGARLQEGRSWRPTACASPFSARQMRSASSSSNCPRLRADKVARPDRAAKAAAAWRPFCSGNPGEQAAAAFPWANSLGSRRKLTRESGDCWGSIRLRAAR